MPIIKPTFTPNNKPETLKNRANTIACVKSN